MNDEIIHFPAMMMRFGSLCRQRCAWCGAVIQERDLANIGMLEADRKPEMRGKQLEAEELGWWSGLVAVHAPDDSGNRLLAHVPDPVDGKAPERSCMVLLPTEPE